MIARTKAGPQPIHHKSLTIEKLSDAIDILMKPETTYAAQEISRSMSHENGVHKAVQSFHRGLPQQSLRCDILPDLPAVWTYRSSKRTIRLSRLAAEILINHLKIDLKKLIAHESRTYHIENRRWDPITGGASAAIGTFYDVGMAFSDASGSSGKGKEKTAVYAMTPDSKSSDTIPTTPDIFEPSISDIESTKLPKRKNNAIAKSFGKAGTALLKGSLVEIPYALAKGLHNAPLMYNDQPRDFGPITNVQSGLTVAGKSLFFGLYDGISGLVLSPIEGAKKEGALGALKGVGKGIGGLYWKPNAGLAGCLGYPIMGVYKSVVGVLRDKIRVLVAQRRREEGTWRVERLRMEGELGDLIVRVLRAWDEVRGKV